MLDRRDLSRERGPLRRDPRRELRERAAVEIAGLGFDGYAIGGVSVGEPSADRWGGRRVDGAAPAGGEASAI